MASGDAVFTSARKLKQGLEQADRVNQGTTAAARDRNISEFRSACDAAR